MTSYGKSVPAAVFEQIHGYEVDLVTYDESMNHAADAFAYGAAAAAHTALATPRIKPMQVPCHYCGAKAGEPCLKWRRDGRRKYLTKRSQSHSSRRRAARLANQAYDALNPR